jgi:hypothetical protein
VLLATLSSPPPAAGHLPAELMARMLSGQLAPEEMRLALAHLLTLCPECARLGEELERLRREVGHGDYVIALTEGPEAAGLLRRLETEHGDAMLQAVLGDPTFHTWGLARRLLRRSREVAWDAPVEAGDLAEVSLAVASRLGAAYDPPWVRDLEALGHGQLASCLRLDGERHAALRESLSARRLLAAGTGDPAVEAELLELDALLRWDGEQYGAAVAHLRRAYRMLGGRESTAESFRTGEEGDTGQGLRETDGAAVADPHLAGRVLAQLAWCQHHLGRPDVAHTGLREAELMIDAAREPRLVLAVGHGLVWSAMVNGWHDVARELLPTSAGLAEELGAETERRSLRRAKARLELAAGHDLVAERELIEVVGEAAERELGIEALDAALDLALVYRDRPAALSRLADGLLPLVIARDLHKAGVAALMAFHAACTGGSLDSERLRMFAILVDGFRPASLSWWCGWRVDFSGDPPAELLGRSAPVGWQEERQRDAPPAGSG